MTKKKWILLAVAVLVLAAIVAAVFLWFIPMRQQPEKPEENNEFRQTVDTVMQALMGEGTSERVLLGADGTPVGISPSEGLAQMITSRLEYEITALDVVDEQTAMVTLEITVPDALQSVKAALEGMDHYDEAVFMENMRTKLETTEHTMNMSVQVQLVLVENCWCLVTNPRFSDAITGGLITHYAQVQQQIMDALGGGEGA